MKVLFWVPYPIEGASNRYRVGQYLPYLDQIGIKYSLRPFWSRAAFQILYKTGHYLGKFYFFALGTIERIVDIAMLSQYDIVFIHREAYPVGVTTFENLVVFLGKPIIFDFDDAIFLPVISKSNSFFKRFKSFNKIKRIIKKSSQVIVGNDYLRDYALRYNSSVSVIPTSIDTDAYYPNPKKYGDKFASEVIIGWIGSAPTLIFMGMMRNIFIKLSELYPYIKFKVVGGKFSVEGLLNVISKEWNLEEEKQDLNSFDIGIMPMFDYEFAKGKCGFKAILYMSMGIPCICSPVGVNKEIIEDGLNGFLAGSEEEWIKKLSFLIEDQELRKKIGLAGRKTVEERYSVKVNAPKFLESIQKVCNTK